MVVRRADIPMIATRFQMSRFKMVKLEERIAPSVCCNPCGGGSHKGGSHKGGSHKGGSHKGGSHKGGSHKGGSHKGC